MHWWHLLFAHKCLYCVKLTPCSCKTNQRPCPTLLHGSRYRYSCTTELHPFCGQRRDIPYLYPKMGWMKPGRSSLKIPSFHSPARALCSVDPCVPWGCPAPCQAAQEQRQETSEPPANPMCSAPAELCALLSPLLTQPGGHCEKPKALCLRLFCAASVTPYAKGH